MPSSPAHIGLSAELRTYCRTLLALPVWFYWLGLIETGLKLQPFGVEHGTVEGELVANAAAVEAAAAVAAAPAITPTVPSVEEVCAPTVPPAALGRLLRKEGAKAGAHARAPSSRKAPRIN
jgi:hypothetical protein